MVKFSEMVIRGGVSESAFMRRVILVSAVALMSAPFTFATTDSCLASSSTSITQTNQFSGVPIAAAGGGTEPDDFESLSSSGVTGCAGTDVQFTNFSETGNTTGGDGGAGGTYVSTLTNQDLTATDPVYVVFSTVRGTDSSTGGNGSNDDGINNWIGGAGSGSSTTYTVDYTANATGTAYFQYFTVDLNGLSVGVTGTGVGHAPGTVSGTFSLCLGGTWNASGTTCSTGASNITTITYNGATSYSLNLGSTYTQIGIENSFTLTNGSGTGFGTTYLTSLGEDFAETPEPSSLLLLAGGLLALLAFRLRPVRLG